METDLDTMLKTEKLPTGVANLNSCLTHVDGKAFSHGGGAKLQIACCSLKFDKGAQIGITLKNTSD